VSRVSRGAVGLSQLMQVKIVGSIFDSVAGAGVGASSF
jgi:hypothetical protein